VIFFTIELIALMALVAVDDAVRGHAPPARRLTDGTVTAVPLGAVALLTALAVIADRVAW
jgi:hypothetical protein